MSKKISLSHYYTSGNTKPNADDLIYGEIAVCIKKGNESIIFKNNENEVVSISKQSNNDILNTSNTFTNSNIFSGKTTFLNEIHLSPSSSIIGDKSPVNIKNGMSVNGNTSIIGTCTSTGGFFDTSDKRLKKFDGDIDVNLDDIKKIKKTYFHYKKDKNKQQHIGVSAQEIEKLYPQIVNVNSDGYLAVDYSKLSVIALKAIDVLSEENKILKTKLNDLEKRLELLENK